MDAALNAKPEGKGQWTARTLLLIPERLNPGLRNVSDSAKTNKPLAHYVNPAMRRLFTANEGVSYLARPLTYCEAGGTGGPVT